jgi:hypothetical protein
MCNALGSASSIEKKERKEELETKQSNNININTF